MITHYVYSIMKMFMLLSQKQRKMKERCEEVRKRRGKEKKFKGKALLLLSLL